MIELLFMGADGHIYGQKFHNNPWGRMKALEYYKANPFGNARIRIGDILTEVKSARHAEEIIKDQSETPMFYVEILKCDGVDRRWFADTDEGREWASEYARQGMRGGDWIRVGNLHWEALIYKNADEYIMTMPNVP